MPPPHPAPDGMPAQLKALAESPAYQAAVSALADDAPGAREHAQRDPEGYLRSHGVDLPAGARARFHSQSEHHEPRGGGA